MSEKRLNRFLARAGVASRRSADALIASGVVRVNGRLPPPAGMLIDPAVDEVTVGGEPVTAGRGHRYLAVHKPAGLLVTARDPGGRPTVFDLMAEATVQGRLFAVGRLDLDTSGLLLMTDHGELANRLAHPRYNVAKEYLASVAGIPAERDLRALREGIDLEDGRTRPATVELAGSGRGRAQLRLVIHEGRNRQVRRMLARVGHPVRELVRVGFGPIRLGRLKPASYRRLRPPEVAALLRLTGLEAAEEAEGEETETEA